MVGEGARGWRKIFRPYEWGCVMDLRLVVIELALSAPAARLEAARRALRRDAQAPGVTVTVAEAARILGVSRETCYRYLERGLLSRVPATNRLRRSQVLALAGDGGKGAE